MVSVKTLFATGAALLAITASATPTEAKIHSIRDSDTPCGTEPIPGIRKPTNDMTITYTSIEAENGLSFEIIYCSGDYFKTSSLNVTVGLGTTSQGMIIGSAQPNYDAAPVGFYGYIFNVTVYPEDITDPQQLSIFEFETGYYNDYNFRASTVTITFEEAPTQYTS